MPLVMQDEEGMSSKHSAYAITRPENSSLPSSSPVPIEPGACELTNEQLSERSSHQVDRNRDETQFRHSASLKSFGVLFASLLPVTAAFLLAYVAFETFHNLPLRTMYNNTVLSIAYFLSFDEIRYTGLGYGEVVFKELREHFAVAEILAFVSIGYLLLLYVLDGFIGLLDDALGKLRFVGIVLAVLALAAAILLSADYYPSAPALVFIFGACASAAAARRYFLHTAEAAEFLAGLAATAVVLGVVVFAAWFCWVILLDNNWSERRQEMYEDGVTCSNSAEAKSGQRCRAAYLMWALPAIVSTLYAITAAICTYLSASIVRHNRGKDSIHPAVRLLILVAALGVSGVWIAVSLSGVEMEVSEILLQVTVLFVALTTFICSAAISLADFYNETQEIPLFQKLQKFLESDWFKGFLVVSAAPLIVLHMLLSSIKHFVRVACFKQCCPNRIRSDEEMERSQVAYSNFNENLEAELKCFTQATRRQIAIVLYSPSSMIAKACILGIAYWLFQVGTGKVVVLFLSWLTTKLSGSPIYVIALTFIAVGIGLFVLLPPVPGVPIYLAGGIIVVSGLVSNSSIPIAFWPATLITIAFVLFIKLLSCAMQQKLIGSVIGGHVPVRQAVGVNSKTMRAVNVILRQPGMAPSKICVLCGAPDWPVGVLCGILRVPLLPVLVGTFPVLFLYLGITVIAGALQLRVNEGNLYKALASTALALAALSMAATMFAALYFIEQTSAQSEELESLPFDEEVLAHEVEVQQRQSIFAEQTQWSNLPHLSRAALVTSLVLIVLAVHTVLWFDQQAFHSFNITDSIQDRLGGDVFKIVKPLGWIALLLFAFSSFLLSIYYVWASRRTTAEIAKKYGKHKKKEDT